MCKYCDKNNHSQKRIEGEYGSICLENNFGRVSIQTYNDGRIIYYPKYCPECGNRLMKIDKKARNIDAFFFFTINKSIKKFAETRVHYYRDLDCYCGDFPNDQKIIDYKMALKKEIEWLMQEVEE